MSTLSIITAYVHPPIPPREFDWCAHRDGSEESGPYGWGLTREEAVMELIRQEDETREEEMEAIQDFITKFRDYQPDNQKSLRALRLAYSKVHHLARP